MTPALVRRQLVLAAVALVAGLGAAAVDRRGGEGAGSALPAAPAASEWRAATVGSYGRGLYGRPTACGLELTPETRGVAHPVLPCGAKLVLSHEGNEVTTEVVDRGPKDGRGDFDVTEALASDLGLAGVEVVEWRFAGEDEA